MRTAIKAILLSALAVGLCFVLRYVYVMFIDPMSAFDAPAPAPTVTATPTPIETPVPAATATPVPTVAATLPPAVTAMPTPTPEPTPTPTPAPTYTPQALEDLSFMKNRVNILLLGWDESPERNDETSEVYRDEENNFRSDVIMLLTVDFSRGRADLISIPRDTFATIYTDTGERFSETGHWKINAAFAKGGSAQGAGFGFAMQTISKLLGGVPIQYYAGVNMAGLKAVVDAMGGVDYDVDVRIELNGRILEMGYQHLDGQQVLDYCRARKGISSDVGRNDRQQRMLFAIFEQLKSRDQLKNFLSIYNSVKDYIETNLSAEQIATLAAFGMDLDMENLHRNTLSGTYIDNTSYSNASYYVLYNEKLVELIDSVFGVEIVPDPRADVAHVQGEKYAAIANEYIASANYLIALCVNAQELAGASSAQIATTAFNAQRVRTAMDALLPLLQREIGISTDVPLDADEIDAATDTLRNAMLRLATGAGFTRESIDKDKVPSGFYKLLPKAD